VRWHLVEAGAPGRYDWSSFLPMLRAAEAAGTQVAWDLCHYGWPDGPGRVLGRLRGPPRPLRRRLRPPAPRGDRPPPVACPVNEISFLAWAGGDMARMNPGRAGAGTS
jgi:hypothetical protein